MENLSSYIDHTNLKQTATKKDIEKLCSEAIEYNFKTVCINPYYLPFAKSILKNEKPLPITVVGFPLGADLSKTKTFQTKLAIENGACEIDMVINIAALLDDDFDIVFDDICQVVNAAGNIPVKVIIETCFLTKKQMEKAAHIIIDAKASFIKTSTGFGKSGAKEEDVMLLKQIANDRIQIKASGGIKTKEDAIKMIQAGATRLGTSSSVEIVNS
jgi:deoxyribose-phosphate aldolase